MKEIKQHWKKYFSIINRIYTTLENSEILASNGKEIRVKHPIFQVMIHNKGFRGVVRLTTTDEDRTVARLLNEAKREYLIASNKKSLPKYFPYFVEKETTAMVISKKPAISSKKYISGRAFMASFFKKNRLDVLSDTNLTEALGEGILEIEDGIVEDEIFLNVDKFIKKHKCNSARVRLETGMNYTASSYTSLAATAIKKQLGVRIVPSNAFIEVQHSTSRKKRSDIKYKYSNALIKIDRQYTSGYATVYKG